MPMFVEMRLDLAMIDAEADGSPCPICKDQIFLRAMQVACVQPDTHKVISTGDYLFCASCGEMVKEHVDAQNLKQGGIVLRFQISTPSCN